VPVDERVPAVVQSLYDAALDESLWPEALRELTELTGSQSASFWMLDPSEQIRLPAFVSINFDPAAIADTSNIWCRSTRRCGTLRRIRMSRSCMTA